MGSIGLADLMLRLIVLLPASAAALSLFGGAEEAVLDASSMTDACLVAVKADINCDSQLLQRISFASHSDVLTSQELDQLCTSSCESSLSQLFASVDSECGDQFFPIDGRNMTYGDLIDYYHYKHGLVCLRDHSTGQFCADVEDSWDIQVLQDSGAATWPQHTTKVYPRTTDPDWPDLVDENGTAIDPFEDSPYRYAQPPSSIIPGGGDAFQDYLHIEGPVVDDTNYGWAEALEFDEFPLEIQCSPCFIDKFKYGLSSRWGDAFDEITVQVLSNMQQNCGQTISFTPALDLRGKGVGVQHIQEIMQIPNCPQYRTVESEADENCYAAALFLSVPTSAVAYLNDVNCASLAGETICAPAPCEITRIMEPAKTTTWLQQYENITEPQFFRWNPYVGLNLDKDVLVCVGPPGGFFTPVHASPAEPTAYTSTASPSLPTQTGTTANCGKYHSVTLGEDCNTITLNHSITFSDLRAMNPSINAECSNLLWGFDYCVALVNGSAMPPETTPTPVPAPGPTTPGVTETPLWALAPRSEMACRVPTQQDFAEVNSKRQECASQFNISELGPSMLRFYNLLVTIGHWPLDCLHVPPHEDPKIDMNLVEQLNFSPSALLAVQSLPYPSEDINHNKSLHIFDRTRHLDLTDPQDLQYARNPTWDYEEDSAPLPPHIIALMIPSGRYGNTLLLDTELGAIYCIPWDLLGNGKWSITPEYRVARQLNNIPETEDWEMFDPGLATRYQYMPFTPAKQWFDEQYEKWYTLRRLPFLDPDYEGDRDMSLDDIGPPGHWMRDLCERKQVAMVELMERLGWPDEDRWDRDAFSQEWKKLEEEFRTEALEQWDKIDRETAGSSH
ncbi:hypothetical protein DV738_g4695, partial [Chaetothyriales sp. CBS 135597]